MEMHDRMWPYALVGLTLKLFLVLSTGANGQTLPPPGTTSLPTVRGTPGAPPPPNVPLISGSQNLEILRHRDPAGKPCLTVNGYARPKIANPSLFEHVIHARNDCAELIKMQVCYYRSQQCLSMETPGRARKEAILGTMPSMKDFRFEFRERF
jgi:hypothetical protein